MESTAVKDEQFFLARGIIMATPSIRIKPQAVGEDPAGTTYDVTVEKADGSESRRKIFASREALEIFLEGIRVGREMLVIHTLPVISEAEPLLSRAPRDEDYRSIPLY